MKKLAAILVTICLIAPLWAWEVMVFPTLGVNIHDQVNFVLPKRGIYVPQLKKVERGQPFQIYYAAVLKETAAETLTLKGKTVVVSPAGKRTVIAEKEYFKLAQNSSGVFTSPHFVKIIMEDGDPDGVYTIEFTVTDGVETKTAVSKVTLTGKMRDDSPVTQDGLNKFFSSYYSAPAPERLLQVCKYFIHDAEPELQKQKNNRYDPRAALYALAQVFKLNPQLWRELAEMSAAAENEKQQQFYALIFAGLGAGAVKMNEDVIPPGIQANIALFAGKDPLHFTQVTQAWQLDALWMEFMITGRFAPVLQLIKEFRAPQTKIVDKAQAKIAEKQPLTAEEKLHLRNFLFTVAVKWSLTSNLRQGHRLLWYYLETIRERKLYPDDFAAAMIAAAIKDAQSKKSTPGSKK